MLQGNDTQRVMRNASRRLVSTRRVGTRQVGNAVCRSAARCAMANTPVEFGSCEAWQAESSPKTRPDQRTTCFKCSRIAGFWLRPLCLTFALFTLACAETRLLTHHLLQMFENRRV